MGFPLLHVLSDNSVPECGVKIKEIIDRAYRMNAGVVTIADYACFDAVCEAYAYAKSLGIKVLCAASVDYQARREGNKHDVPGGSASKDVFRIVLIVKDDAGYEQLCRILSRSVSFGRKGYKSCAVNEDVLKDAIKEKGHLICLTGGFDGISRLFGDLKEESGVVTGTSKGTDKGEAGNKREINANLATQKADAKVIEKQIKEMQMVIDYAEEKGEKDPDAEDALKRKKKELSKIKKSIASLKAEKENLAAQKPAMAERPAPTDNAVLELKEVFGDGLFIELSPSTIAYAPQLILLSKRHSLHCVFGQDAVTLSGTEEELKRLYLIRDLAPKEMEVPSGAETQRRLYTEAEIWEEFHEQDPDDIKSAIAWTKSVAEGCKVPAVFTAETGTESGDVPTLRERVIKRVREKETELYGVSINGLLYSEYRKERLKADGIPEEGMTYSLNDSQTGQDAGTISIVTSRDAFEKMLDGLGPDNSVKTVRIMKKERLGIREAFHTAGHILSGRIGHASRETGRLAEKIDAYFQTRAEEEMTDKAVLNEIRGAFGNTAAYQRIAWAVRVLSGLFSGRYLLSTDAAVFEGAGENGILPVPDAVCQTGENRTQRVLFTGLSCPGYKNAVTAQITLEPCPYADILLACAGKIRGKKDFPNMFLQDEKRRVFEQVYSAGRAMHIYGADTEKTVGAWKRIVPKTMDDIVAGIVLSGAKNNMPLYSYVKRKNENEYINYRFSSLKKITGPTFGRFLYKEQAIDAICVAAGYGQSRSLILYSVMNSGNRRLIEEEKEGFVNACVSVNGRADLPENHMRAMREDATALFNEIKKAVPYLKSKDEVFFEASLSYACAYMKLEYPKEYMTAVISYVPQQVFPSAVAECGRMGIRVLLPDINRAYPKAAVTCDGDIFCGFENIRGLEENTDRIVQERKNGVYKGLVDFMTRTGFSLADTGQLIKAGAFDFETGDRRTAIREAGAIESAVMSKKNVLEKLRLCDNGTVTENSEILKRGLASRIREIDEKLGSVILPRCGLDPAVNAVMEKEVFGTTVGAHPLDGCLEAVPGAESVEELRNGKRIIIAGVVREAETFHTVSKNKEMGTFRLEDKSGMVKVVVFPECFDKYAQAIRNGAVVRVKGTCIRDRVNPEETIVTAKEISDVSGTIKPVVIDGNLPGWEETVGKYASVYGHPVILLRNGRLETAPVLAGSRILDEDPDFARECYSVFAL